MNRLLLAAALALAFAVAVCTAIPPTAPRGYPVERPMMQAGMVRPGPSHSGCKAGGGLAVFNQMQNFRRIYTQWRC